MPILSLPYQLLIITMLAISQFSVRADDSGLSFHKSDDRIVILNGQQSVSEYIFADPHVPRPYLINVKTLDGIQITRNHPVQPLLFHTSLAGEAGFG